jgi:hypothetical protein
MVPSVGRVLVLNQLKILPTHMAVGTGTTPPADGDTGLAAELAREPITDGTVNADVSVTYYAMFTSGEVGGQTIREVGLFGGTGGSTLLARALHTYVVPAGYNMDVEYTVPLGSA